MFRVPPYLHTRYWRCQKALASSTTRLRRLMNKGYTLYTNVWTMHTWNAYLTVLIHAYNCTTAAKKAQLQQRRYRLDAWGEDRLVDQTGNQMETRLPVESEEEKVARPQQMIVRLAADTPRKKDAMLQWMNTYQPERLAAETEGGPWHQVG